MRVFFTLLPCLLSIVLHSQPGAIDLSFNNEAAGYGYGAGANALVTGMTVQPDGKIIIFGNFTAYNGVAVKNIARLHENGRLDTSFDPGTGPTGWINSVAVQEDGKILAAGNLLTYNGAPVNRMIRLLPDGSLDPAFNAGETGTDNEIKEVTILPDGKMFIRGFFNTYNGEPRNRLARLNADGSLDASFDPGAGPNFSVSAVAFLPDGKMLIGGNFTTYGGAETHKMARLNADGSLDTTFNPGWGLPVQGEVYSIGLQQSGDIIIYVWLRFPDGIVIGGVKRMYPDGGLDNTFSAGLDGGISPYGAVVQPDDKILVYGISHVSGTFETFRAFMTRLHPDGSPDTDFSTYLSSWMVQQSFIQIAVALQADGKILTTDAALFRLHTDGSRDCSFNPLGGAQGPVYTMILQPDGKILIGGNMPCYNDETNSGIARLHPDGNPDEGFNSGSGANARVVSLAMLSDGKICAGGSFSIFNGQPRGKLAFLNADGSLIPTAGDGFNGEVSRLCRFDNDKVIAAGWFTTYNGGPANRVVMLNADGTRSPGFDVGSGPNGMVFAVLVQPDNRILIAGAFNSFNGVSRRGIVRLHPDGSLDTSFDTGTGPIGAIADMTFQPDGKIVAVGNMSSFNGITARGIVRLHPDGSVDTEFDAGTGVNNWIQTVVVQPDGEILIGGDFTFYNGTPVNRLARLNADGSLDHSFDTGTGANQSVFDLALQPDGKVLMAGSFTAYQDVWRASIARVLTGEPVPATEPDMPMRFRLYPNPNSGDFVIESNRAYVQAGYGIRITDALGREIFRAALTSERQPVSLPAQLPAGLYVLRVVDVTGHLVETVKVVLR
jgi:uncharacterized delta-60 repeat protein